MLLCGKHHRNDLYGVEWNVKPCRLTYLVVMTVVTCDCTERKRQPTPAGSDVEKKDEEEWLMKDVVFIEDVKTVPIGKVLKVNLVFSYVLEYLMYRNLY